MILLDGHSLTIEHVQLVAERSEPVRLTPDAIESMLRSRAVVERLAAGDEPVYAVNTGVGLMADVRVAPADLEQLQRNVVRSHAAGIGDPLARYAPPGFRVPDFDGQHTTKGDQWRTAARPSDGRQSCAN